jgi:hypothetical protein
MPVLDPQTSQMTQMLFEVVIVAAKRGSIQSPTEAHATRRAQSEHPRHLRHPRIASSGTLGGVWDRA